MGKALTAKQRLKAAKEWTFRNKVDAWCLAHRLPIPVYEHRFHETRKWRFDIAFPQAKIAIEIHGGLFRFGHHSRGKGFLDDREKIAEAMVLGWRVLEVAPSGKHPNTLCSPELVRWVKALL